MDFPVPMKPGEYISDRRFHVLYLLGAGAPRVFSFPLGAPFNEDNNMETGMTDNDKHYVWRVTRIALIAGLAAMMFYSLMGWA